MPRSATVPSVDQQVERLTFGASRLERGGPSATRAPTLRRVLAAIDGGDATTDILSWARRLARLDDAEIDLVSVVRPAYALAQTRGMLSWELDTKAVREAERVAASLLGTASTQMRLEGFEVATTLASGPPAREIERLAGFRHADLVVIGSHAHTPLARVLLGSVADALKAHCPANLLVVKGSAFPRRILAAVDGSSTSRRAAAVALRLGRAFHVTTELVHVVEPPFGTASEGHDQMRRALAEAGLVDPTPLITHALEFGRAARRIVERARTTEAGLVVMGSRGLSGVDATFLGSVSNAVLHEAPASVLLVKPAP